jgi:hypothetical protein
MTHAARYEIVVRLMRFKHDWREAAWQEWWVPTRTKHAAEVDALCAESQERARRMSHGRG